MYITTFLAMTLVLIEYIAVYTAATVSTTDIPACEKTYDMAYQGWDAGVCITEEQLWCRVHGMDKHPECKTADCRAEEIRLSLKRDGVPDRTPVYTKCEGKFEPMLYDFYDHLLDMNSRAIGWAGNGTCAACVPSSDKRARYLPSCNADVAECRGFFYLDANRTHARSSFSADTCAASRNASCKADIYEQIRG